MVHTSGMKFQTKIGERGQVVIPKAIRDQLGLDKNSAIFFEMKGNTVTLTSQCDMRRFEKGLSKWRGKLRKQMLEDGYTSTEALMQDLRGR